MNSLISKFNNIDINSQYIIPAPPTIFSSTHFYLTGFESNEVVDIIANYLKIYGFDIQFINKRNIINWNVYKSYSNNIDFPHCEYSIAIYLKNKEHIIEVFKLFGTDELYMTFFKGLEDLFR
jgi:hypothetical protein